VGQLLVIVLLGSLTYAIIDAPDAGLFSARIVGLAVLVVASLAALLWYEPRREEPLIDIRFFRSAPFSGATAIAVCAFSGLAGFLFLNTLFLQDAQGLSALRAGVWMLPMALMTFLCAPLSGRIVGARGPRIPLLIAGCAIALSGLLFAVFHVETSGTWRLIGYVVFGIGFGFVNAPITNTAVSGMPRSQAGVAAAFASTSRQIGSTLGVAVIGAVLASGGVSSSGHGAAFGRTFSAASAPAWWILTVCGVLVLVLGALTSGRWAHTTAQRTAERLRAPEVVAEVMAGR
jgi:predicted MFS family arabinose efflux permease